METSFVNRTAQQFTLRLTLADGFRLPLPALPSPLSHDAARRALSDAQKALKRHGFAVARDGDTLMAWRDDVALTLDIVEVDARDEWQQQYEWDATA